MKKIISFLLISALVLSIVPFSAFAQSVILQDDIVSISYDTEYHELMENIDGEWDNQDNYFRYYCNFHAGDRLTVNYSISDPKVFTAEYIDRELYFTAENEEPIKQWEDIFTSHNQRENNWVVGGEYTYKVEYMGMQADVSVKVVANPISAVVYTPVSDIEVYEYTGGEWIDVDGQPVYEYMPPWFKVGDRLSITYSENGETVVYTYCDNYDSERNEWYYGFYDEQLNQLSDNGFIYVARDGRYNWGPDADNYMYVVYNRNRSNDVKVSIVPNPVKAIRFEREIDVILVENYDMYHDEQDDKDYYSIPYHQEGDRLIVIDNDDNETVYNYQVNGVYTCEGKDDIPAFEVNIDRNQRDNPWGLGKNEYIVEYMGRTCALTATVIENTVKAIRYERADGVEYFENTNGDYDDEYGYYHYWYNSYDDGDKLTVIETDDSETVYEYKLIDEEKWEYAFVSESGDTIDPDRINFDDEQYMNHWHIGSDNEYYVEYMGALFYLYATIKENPVKAIRFVPANEPTVMVGVRSYHDAYSGIEIFNEPWLVEGDKLTVIDKNDNVKVYTAEYDERHDIVFKAADGDEISGYDISLGSNQWDEPWTVGGDNEYYVEYLGARSYVKCALIENPVESIEFIPAEITKYLEGTNMYYDEWRECDVYELPRVKNGDMLVVNYNDVRGRVEYVAAFDNAGDRMTYVSNQGDIIVEDEKFEFYDEQDYEPWTVGENHYSIAYCGKSTQVLVVIKENNITGISYTSSKMPQVWATDYNMDIDDTTGSEYKHYNIPDLQDGDILTIHYNDETSKNFVLTFDESDGERYFVNGDEKYHQYTLFRSDNQYESEWQLGDGNYYSIDFYGFTTNVEVEVIETDVESISFTPANAIVLEAEKDGEFMRDDNGEQFYFYNRVRIVNAGDKLTVTYIGGEVVTYTLADDGTGENWILRSDDGKEIDPYEIDIDDHQWENHWVVGTNHFDIVYHGVRTTADVTIKAAYIPGDINGDGKVNNKDLTRLFQYLSRWNVEVNEAALDVNGDGKVNNKDLTRLFQYLSNWNVEIH